MTHPRRARTRTRALGATLALGALAATAVAPATAGAASTRGASATGATTIELTGRVATSLRSQGVVISARRPARAGRQRIVLPVATGSVTRSATLDHAGAVTFRKGRGRAARIATFSSWQTKLTPRRSTISAKLGRRRLTLFVLTLPSSARTAAVDTVKLRSSTARLTDAGARALRKRLELTELPAGVLGTSKVDATVGEAGTGGGSRGGTGGGGGSGSPTTPGTPSNPTTPGNPGTPTPDPRADPRCQGFGIGTVPEASAPLARTAGAGPVSATAFWWRPKDSWVRYISTGEGGTPSNGAFAGAAEVLPGSSASLVYRYGFALNAGASWYDASTRQGVLHYGGAIRWKWAGHGIDISMRDPEVQLDGANSRLVFRFTGTECSVISDKRVDFARLATPAPSGANPIQFGALGATLTDAGNTAFGGMYVPATEWGSVDLSITP